MRSIDRFYSSLGEPIQFRSRIVLGLLVVPLALSFAAPLWTMNFTAPQYPAGLELRIYAHTVDGDVNEINTLNHYIGMARLDHVSLSDLDWIPFAIGALALFTLRVAAIGDLRSLVDLVAVLLYFSGFSLARFAYRLYVIGHHLDPKAPFHMEPFTPALIGTRQIANFTTASWPGWGSAALSIFAVGLLGVLAWNLLRVRAPQRAPAS
jgi:hypothetical protein